MKPKSSTVVPLPRNLIDRIWTERPSRPQNEIFPLSVEYAGKSSKDKIAQLREHLESKKASAIVVSMLDEVAWLFNLRGSDIAYNPGVQIFLRRSTEFSMRSSLFFIRHRNQGPCETIRWSLLPQC